LIFHQDQNQAQLRNGKIMAIDFIDDSYLDDSNTGNGTYLNGLSAASWMAWVKSDSIDTDAGWMIGINPSGDDTHFNQRFDDSGFSSGNDDCLKPGLSLSSGQHNRETAADTQTTDWLHVCCRWASGTVMQIYLDGVEDTTATGITGDGSGTTTTDHGPLNVGRGGKAASEWNGLVADLRIYNRQLSVNEIQTIYALKGQDRIFNGLLVRYTFMEGAPGVSIGTTTDLIKDISNAASRHLTRQGTSASTWTTDILRLGGRRR
jgi:hypothetical protein